MKNKTLAIAVLMAIIPTINIVKMDAKTITLPAEEITMTEEWDKVFPKSDKVDHRKVTFPNRYGITLVADLYIPKNAEGPLPAIAVCGPSALSRNSRQDSMLRSLPKEVSTPSLSTRRSPARAAAFHAI